MWRACNFKRLEIEILCIIKYHHIDLLLHLHSNCTQFTTKQYNEKLIREKNQKKIFGTPAEKTLDSMRAVAMSVIYVLHFVLNV
jgi:hypothetical protein